jgi:hypothetical protein
MEQEIYFVGNQLTLLICLIPCICTYRVLKFGCLPLLPRPLCLLLARPLLPLLRLDLTCFQLYIYVCALIVYSQSGCKFARMRHPLVHWQILKSPWNKERAYHLAEALNLEYPFLKDG